MLKLGDKNIKKLYQGYKLITKMCLGDKLIYHKQPTLLEYIEFDGQSYINTGICATTNTRVEATFYTTVQHTGFYGVYTTYKRLSSYINGAWRFGNTDTTVRDIQGILVDSIHDKNGVVINGNLLNYSATPAEFVGKEPMFLGWTNGCPISWDKFQGKLYKFKVYENDVLVGDFKPCINPNGVVCFYDTVTKKYFYNIGTGQFKAGGRFVKSILFDGASYIDTGIIPTNNTGAYCKLVSSAKDQTFLGSRNDSGNTRLGLICTNYAHIGLGRAEYLYLNQDGSIAYKDVSDRVLTQMNNPLELWSNFNNDKKLRVKQGEIDVTGQPIKDVSFTPQFTMFLGGMNITGVHKSACTGKVLQCQITEGNTLLLDLRPFVDENEVACFYDMVTGTKFYNQGTGTLGYTEE